MILSSPELETDLKTAEYQAKSAEADYLNLKATLQKAQLDLQSAASQTQTRITIDGQITGRPRSTASEKRADLRYRRQDFHGKGQATAGSGRVSGTTRGSDQVCGRRRYNWRRNRTKVDSRSRPLIRVEEEPGGSAQRFCAGFAGMLEALRPRRRGSQKPGVAAGTPLGKVAQPRHLKAELKIAEAQVKDVMVGQLASIDTRLSGGEIERIDRRTCVSRIDTSIINGTVTVDVALKGALPCQRQTGF